MTEVRFNLGNVSAVVISNDIPVEEDGITEKRYVLWAFPLNTAMESYELRYYNDYFGGWVPLFTLPDVGIAGTYTKVTTDTKGRVIAGQNPTTLAGYGITDAAPLSHVGSNGIAQHALATGTVAGFSEADFTAAEKTKLGGVATGAQVNVIEIVQVAGVALAVISPKTVNIPQATATVIGAALLGATNGAARYGQKADAGLGNVDNVQQIPMTQRGAANGVATLDSTTKVPTAQLPDFILGQMMYGGTFVPSTRVATLTHNAQTKLGTTAATITLTNDTTAITGYAANQGMFYLASAAGSFTGVTSPFEVGDWLVSTGSGWAKIDNTDAVVSVNGKVGAVTLTYSDVGGAPANIAIAAETGTGVNITTPAIASNTNQAVVQAVWAKLRQVANAIPQDTIGEAPINGLIHGRKDAQWVPVEDSWGATGGEYSSAYSSAYSTQVQDATNLDGGIF